MAGMVSEYTIPTINVARNAFERHHSWKGDCEIGLLYPIFFDEVLPGDTKQLNSTFFGRINPTITPVLDNIWLDVHYFFVPNRLVWDNWQKFMGERENPSDSIDYLVPTITSDSSDGFERNGFFDYLSVPPAIPSLTLSSAVFYARAYNLIWNEWYRSELLQESVTVPKGDSGDTESIYQLLPRGKRQDYFTSGFTAPQLGAGASISIGQSAPVIGNGNALGFSINNSLSSDINYRYNHYQSLVSGGMSGGLVGCATANSYNDGSVQIPAGAAVSSSYTSVIPTVPPQNTSIIEGFMGVSQNPDYSGLIADLSSVSPITINTLRQAIAIQQFLERDLMRGHRYVELLLSHYGVRCPDFRLQRPEYLGGSTTRVNINPVTQVSSTDNTSPQGNLTGNGVIASSENGFTHSFTEHGVILGLASFRIDLNYQQGVDRHFLRNSRYDYFFPTLAHLGMQGITNKEIFAQGDGVVDSSGDIVDNQLFSYNTRFEEYRYKNSYITGTLRSSHPQSLDIWHLAENFENLPVLNDEFITVSDTLKRIMTVQSEKEIILDVWHEYTDVREVPMYGLPGLERI